LLHEDALAVDLAGRRIHPKAHAKGPAHVEVRALDPIPVSPERPGESDSSCRAGRPDEGPGAAVAGLILHLAIEQSLHVIMEGPWLGCRLVHGDDIPNVVIGD